jgi:sarcosine oxidase subunit beta
MRDRVDTLIVGAGIMGLSIAYQLAKRGVRDILVVDRGYLCGGASGRNGGGVRAQWSSTDNIALMRESIRMCKDFASEHRINVWFRQGGYLFLARSPEMRASLERNTALQNEPRPHHAHAQSV